MRLTGKGNRDIVGSTVTCKVGKRTLTRYVKGGADNPKMAAFGDVVLDMARKAAELARMTRL